MRGKARKSIVPVTLAMVVAMSFIAACSKGNSTGSANGNGGAASGEKAPLQLSIIAPGFNAQPPKPDTENPAMKKLEDMTNTKWDLQLIPDSNYADKLNVVMASNNLPKMVVIKDRTASTFINAAKAGQFWEVGPYLKDYPNLSKNLSAITITNDSIDGKLYGVPRPRVVARVGLIIRKDWLDALGLPPPKTQDDLYKVIKAFTLDDPDKDGKADTIGWGYANDPFWTGLLSLSVPNGGFNGWGLKDGKVTPDFMMKPYDDALAFVRQLYAEKLIPQDFAAPGYDVKKLFLDGKIGMYFSAYDDATSIGTQLQKTNPKAKVIPIPALQGSKGELTPATAGHAGLISFPKSSVKSEAELKQILAFLDRMVQPDATHILLNGIEGVHYKSENGVDTWTDRNAYTNDVYPFIQFVPVDLATPVSTDTALDKLIKQYNSDYLKKAVPNLADPFVSPTWVEKGTELKKITDDARIKYVMGGSEADWQKAKQDWLDRGGSKVIDEYTASYNQANKK